MNRTSTRALAERAPAAPTARHLPPRAPRLALGCASLALATGCLPHRIYNETPERYLQSLPVEREGAATADLAIIEFDDHGLLWKRDQLEDAVALIRRRNAQTEHGTVVVVFVHGWQNDADPRDEDGAMARFRRAVVASAEAQALREGKVGDHVVGVFLGWRGDTSDVPLLDELTFWGRLAAAERVVSLQMRETVLRVMNAAREHPGSKCLLVGHSMGGMIVAKLIAPTLTTLLLAHGSEGFAAPTDLVLLQNPATDALSSWQLVDLLKRTGARVELRSPDGGAVEAAGPIVASLTSESDRAIRTVYPIGRGLGGLTLSFRRDHEPGRPSQRDYYNHAEGDVQALVSHRAWLQDGELVIEPVPDAYNDTPYWIIEVSREISSGHGDINSPANGQLVERLLELNHVYRSDLETWVVGGGDP